MAQWNIRFNDELIGPFDDAETQAISQKLTTSTRTQGGVVFSGKLADSGNDVTAYWTPGCPSASNRSRTGRDRALRLHRRGVFMQYLAYSTLNQDEQLGMGAHEVVHAHRFVMVVHRRFADGFFIASYCPGACSMNSSAD
jgi:hypothetical protein